ncbi:hypothetical protein ACLVWU_08435 [Bdellovibrio sp. HCB290]|uniref:hypothetical protein n=1 Tax=Bdellovibrio sp. HCB290 TaxID=3394356 RepID=UPI0039B5B7BC
MNEVLAAEKVLESDAGNIELRIEVMECRLFQFSIYDQVSVDHALWFVRNVPLHSYTWKTCMVIAPSGAKDVLLKAWEEQVVNSNRHSAYLRAVARYFRFVTPDVSLPYLKELLKRSPFNKDTLQLIALREESNLPTGYEATHPFPGLRVSLYYWKRYIEMQWSSFLSEKVDQVRWRYPVLFPKWYCVILLVVISLFKKKENEWFNCYDVGVYGMSAYYFGDYELSKKCAKQFLKIQPEAEKKNNYPGIFAKGFSLVGMLALKEGDMDTLHQILNKKCQDPAETEFDFLFHDKDLLMELALKKRSDIALQFILDRLKGREADPATIYLMDYIRGGGIPYSAEHFDLMSKRSKEEAE